MKLPILIVLFANGVLPGKLDGRWIDSSGRIVGGHEVSIESHPYQVGVLYYRQLICGGSVISPTIVMTAAHCIREEPRFHSIRAGSSFADSGGQVVAVNAIRVHPKFNEFILDYDVAIIKLAAPLQLSASIARVSLPETGAELIAGTFANVTGWGETDSGDYPQQLQGVTVAIVSHEDCRKAHSDGGITARMLCAGEPHDGGKDSCFGDSGGPLVTFGKQYGIVSWGIHCGHPRFPGVYTKVAAVRGWIRQESGV